MTLGSWTDNDVVIPVPGVSRRHAQVERADGRWLLIDERSTNFVFVGDQPVKRHLLDHRTVFTLGDHARLMYLEILDQPAIDEFVRAGAQRGSLDRASTSMAVHRELPKSVLELETLIEVGASINSSLDLGTVLKTLLEKALALTRAERGFVMLLDDSVLVTRVARNMETEVVDSARQAFSRTFARKVIDQGQTMTASDLDATSRFSSQSIIANNIHSIMCAPLKIHDEVIGCLYVDVQKSLQHFSESSASFFTALANQAAIAIHNARMAERLMAQERLNQEIEYAQRVQQLLMPKKLPALAGLEFSAKIALTNRVGGDYYDFIRMDDRRLAVVLADVSGHDVASAIVMAMGRTLVRSLLSWQTGADSPAAILGRIDAILAEDSEGQWFVAMFLGILDVGRRTLTYSNAGNPNPLLLRRGRAQLSSLEAGGVPLGLAATGQGYDEEIVQLDPGDLLVLYTDGLTEAQSPSRELFGLGRVERLVVDNRARPVEELAESIYRSALDFTDQGKLQDDFTLVAIRALTSQA